MAATRLHLPPIIMNELFRHPEITPAQVADEQQETLDEMNGALLHVPVPADSENDSEPTAESDQAVRDLLRQLTEASVSASTLQEYNRWVRIL